MLVEQWGNKQRASQNNQKFQAEGVKGLTQSLVWKKVIGAILFLMSFTHILTFIAEETQFIIC